MSKVSVGHPEKKGRQVGTCQFYKNSYEKDKTDIAIERPCLSTLCECLACGQILNGNQA